jgi:hypothetical protein
MSNRSAARSRTGLEVAHQRRATARAALLREVAAIERAIGRLVSDQALREAQPDAARRPEAARMYDRHLATLCELRAMGLEMARVLVKGRAAGPRDEPSSQTLIARPTTPQSPTRH